MTAAPPSDLEDHVGFWLRMVSNAVAQSFAGRVEAAGVAAAEWVFLRTLYGADGIAPSELAERMGMTRGAISKLADRFVEKALVVRHADPKDRRGQTLVLSPAARNLVPRLAQLADDNDAAFFASLDTEERADLVRLLRKLATARSLRAPPLA